MRLSNVRPILLGRGYHGHVLQRESKPFAGVEGTDANQVELVQISLLDLWSEQDWVEVGRGKYSERLEDAQLLYSYPRRQHKSLRLPIVEMTRTERGRIVYDLFDGNHRSLEAARAGKTKLWVKLLVWDSRERTKDYRPPAYDSFRFLDNYVHTNWRKALPVRGDGHRVRDYVPNRVAPKLGLPVVRRTREQTAKACRMSAWHLEHLGWPVAWATPQKPATDDYDILPSRSTHVHRRKEREWAERMAEQSRMEAQRDVLQAAART